MKLCPGPCVGHDGGCNWLDWMAEDDKCPHCGGPVTWFKPAPAGAILDAMRPA